MKIKVILHLSQNNLNKHKKHNKQINQSEKK